MIYRKIVALASAAVLAVTLTACSSDAPQDDAKASQSSAWNGQEATVKLAGQDTVVEFPSSGAPKDLQIWVQEEGTGEEIAETDSVMAHYVGQVWGNDKPFDSSFARSAPSVFSLQSVIPGWTQGLSGLKVGTKVILSVPSDLGYGPSGGNASAGIGEDDVIVFYVELLDKFSVGEGGQADAQMEADLASLPVTLDGELGKKVTVTVKDGQEEPKEVQTIVIAKGSGEPVGGEGTALYVQYSMADWANENPYDTYAQPDISQVTVMQDLAGLAGVPVGSRVLILVPASDGENEQQRHPAYAAVIDILAQMPAIPSAQSAGE